MAGERRRISGWMMFDWASQPYNTLLLTFVFGPYFATVVGDATEAQVLWGRGLTVAGLCIALSAPVLGAMADAGGRRLPWIAGFSLLYVLGASALWFAVPDMQSAWLASAWALGYVGGVLALGLMLAFFAENEAGMTLLGNPPALGLDPAMREGTRFVGPFTALWYALFMIPFFLWVREPARPRLAYPGSGAPLAEVWRTLRSLPARPSLAAFLASSMLYRDALNGIFAFGGIYAIGVLGWSVVEIGVFGIAGAVSGAVFTWAGGFADRRFGPKPVIAASIVVLTLVCLVIVGMTREALWGLHFAPGSTAADAIFYGCGVVIGAAGGILQATSRGMMVRQADPARMTESFGLYALAGKATTFVAPFTIALTTDLTGDQRLGIAPLVGLFLLALGLLVWVKPDGERPAP
ncbi:MAG: MFS transporter [Alphaproteobacteria bacterium HGW-Alphaproteobacteria-2]|nr:MAG: MFS transporter [Alphaproteobacteria bacterium HGW-Alphaproteobacteria-2]